MALANYSSRHWLLTLSGDLFAPSAGGIQEHWSIGLRFIGASAQVAPTQADVDAMLAPSQAWFSSSSLGISISHKLTLIKLAPIAQTGLYPTGENAVQTAPFSTAGNYSATGSWPPQCALAVSTTTGLSRGRAHIGRFYLPPLGITFEADGTINTATQTNILTPTRTWLNAIAATKSELIPTVMSRFGDQHRITGLRVGQVVDTQRRRRRSLPEIPMSLAL